MGCYLDSLIKAECFGCEACVQICPQNAIEMKEDEEGFLYPHIAEEKCIHCNLCRNVCSKECMPKRYKDDKYAFGGYIEDSNVRNKSTSGGAFSAIVNAFCDNNYIIFGAEAKGLSVFHSYISDVDEIDKFRKSKYSQSKMGTVYKDCKKFLAEGKKVLFSGTPCQIAGLKAFLGDKTYDNLLTVEVICEGVPSPYYIRKYDVFLETRYGSKIKELDYRYTDANSQDNPTRGKWDFEVMKVKLKNGRIIKVDRWFNPFWSVWLNHLISRPSCYECPFATTERAADISLGDLWGVHLYCPELYGNNMGASLVVCNTKKGKEVFCKAQKWMNGHELNFDEALKYQSPMRKAIDYNDRRSECMADLMNSKFTYTDINNKWAHKPTLKLLWQKYVWGNRQKIAWWNLTKNR